MEYRVLGTDLSCIEDTKKIGGYINVTERESEILYSKNKGKWFKETMKRGVFERALNKAEDIPLLLQHDWNKRLASTSNKTLSLREDQVGLRFEAEIEDEKLYDEIRNGKINSCSFGFSVITEKIEPVNNRLEKRNVEEINLYEVSLVKNPAYEGSIVEARQYEQALKMDEETLLNSSEDNTVTITVKKQDTEEVREVNSEENEESKKDENKDGVSSKDKKVENSIDESKEDTDTSLESEFSEKSEDSKNKKSEDTKEDSEDKESEETKEDSEDKEDKPKEKRNEGLDEGNQFENITSSPTELKSLINELIDSKLLDIEKAKTNEQIAQEELESVKCINSLIEEDCESIHIEKMNELIKLEIELLKLKEIKGRIQ